jgi:hypothetical protein
MARKNLSKNFMRRRVLCDAETCPSLVFLNLKIHQLKFLILHDRILTSDDLAIHSLGNHNSQEVDMLLKLTHSKVSPQGLVVAKENPSQ